tara:strand:- start:64 stop:240 length:177 start_codon:yes stop_codon:yes gene_type:complete
MVKILQYLILFIILTSCSARQAECVKKEIETGKNRKCFLGKPVKTTGGYNGTKIEIIK